MNTTEPTLSPLGGPKTSVSAIMSLVFGIIGMCLPILSIPAVILGHFALNAVKKSSGLITGGGLAIGGLVTGYIGVAFGLGFLALVGLGGWTSIQAEKKAAELFPIADRAVPAFPELPEFTILEPSKVRVAQVKIDQSGAGGAMEFRIYLPAESSDAGKIPCVLVAPAGTNLLTGSDLDPLGSDSYHDEALPYAEAGIAAILYSIDGNLAEDEEDDDAMEVAYKSFRAAGAGTLNGRNAFDFALAKLPMVDPDQIFAVGHSSAGTLALLMAAHETRLRGAVAYAPCGDVEHFLKEVKESPMIEMVFPGLGAFTKRSSPTTHLDKIKCPVFLFYANDDSNITKDDADAFVSLVREHPVELEIRRVSSGGHYQSMISEGIPAGIDWIKSQ